MASPHSKHARRRDSRPAQRSLRAADARVQRALTTAREQRARLDARIALEKARADEAAARELMERTEGESRRAAEILARQAMARVRAEKEAEARRELWPLGPARSLIRQGYSLEGTIARTGWPREWLADARSGLEDD